MELTMYREPRFVSPGHRRRRGSDQLGLQASYQQRMRVESESDS